MSSWLALLVSAIRKQDENAAVLIYADYQRTYTWDKKLESWVKDTGLLGAGKGEPTIITPKQYRQRFLSAMERYFPMVGRFDCKSLVTQFVAGARPMDEAARCPGGRLS
jgi:hypothetical protein